MNFDDLIQAVVKECKGWTWKADNEYRERFGIMTHTKTGARAYVRSDGGRVEFSPSWPRGECGHNYTKPETGRVSYNVTVSSERGPEAISKDVRRRLLDAYPAEYSEMLAVKAADEKEEAKRIKTAKKLAALLGVTPPVSKYDKESEKAFSCHSSSVSLHVRVEYSGSITFDRFTVSNKIGAAVLKTIRRELIKAGELTA